MRCLFVVQGEGRGHMTQAIAMKHLLEQAGHTVVATLVGASPRREIPEFFINRMGGETRRFQSPNFAADPDNRGIRVGRTIWTSLVNAPEYIRGFRVFNEALMTFQPDLVINFYEPLWGLYQVFSGNKCPSVCIAHQCLTLHPEFQFPPGHRRDRFLLRALTRIAVFRASAILALSFTPLPTMKTGRVHVVPPLLRPEVFEHEISSGDYLLVYLMSAGYAADITSWHEKNPSTKLHCFWDRRDAPDTDRRDATLSFHRISDVRFLSMMAGCRGLVTTAGFESVCEAMYLGKPVLMMPVHQHYEQLCNALDGERAGAGIQSDHFDLDQFVEYLKNHDVDSASFRDWSASAPSRIVPLLERAGSKG